MELKQSRLVLVSALAAAFFALNSAASAAAPDGHKLAAEHCLQCHEIKGNEDTGNVAPALSEMKKRFPDRKELIAVISDETKRNTLTVMPPFKRNLIMNDTEIEAVVDYLYTR